jgi:glycosyltransferase involved in cell wall biosynthesis
MSAEIKERPLVTFALFAYRQEQFIREAVAGALAQTYSPLEIILSDDCSTDRTYAIMQEMAAAYRGPHTVRLRQTAKNGGLAAHFNSVMALAAGELVVVAAGDDISLPHRVETLTKEWISAGRPSGIASAMSNINEEGKLIGLSNWAASVKRHMRGASREEMLRQFVHHLEFILPGCAAAWAMEAWNKFGNLRESVVNEDAVLSFRSNLDRGIHLIEESLVLYRQHDNNIWNARVDARRASPVYYKLTETEASKRESLIGIMYESALSDLKTAVAREMLDAVTAQAIEADIIRQIGRCKIRANWWLMSALEKLSSFPDSPHRRFPLNLTSLLPLNQHSVLRCLLARIKRDTTL